ncbi:hypothetical protein GF367_04475 [Candidatus Woesearchaeota archaeon]|nr:hypothetical protein [Candidatus Woesearchaeota archaeon]
MRRRLLPVLLVLLIVLIICSMLLVQNIKRLRGTSATADIPRSSGKISINIAPSENGTTEEQPSIDSGDE